MSDMDEHFDKGQAAGLAIASATRNSTDAQVAELVTREFADLHSPQAAVTCVATLAKILTQHFNAEVKLDNLSTALAAIIEAIRVAFAEEQTADQLGDAVRAAVSNLNRNELAGTLASFVVGHYHLEAEGDEQ
ncbi:hypothetical protein QM583_10250 [Gordonia alkanivorans]|uniref:hypothetical protein n=1 Tax=Gordonia alkanivorans TaxID=84096 RepID=UPI0024B79872|nr:hypothetical protein [Gordonia alkanivorans]MDJ0027473.1 hypothetical protein [Gordonia alkanivorans]